MRITLISILVFCFVMLLSCADTNNNKPFVHPINPNGDSELALLMRDMFEEGMNMREEVKQGKIPTSILEFEKIHSAKATEPEKAASDEYKEYSDSFLQTIAALKTGDEEDATHLYTAMVNSCMSCHQAMCPGPMVRIKKMYLE